MAALSSSSANNIIGRRYDELIKPLASIPDLLPSLSETFLEASVIDAQTSKLILTTNSSGSTPGSTSSSDGARLLLDVLSMRLDQSADYELLITGILKEKNDLELVIDKASYTPDIKAKRGGFHRQPAVSDDSIDHVQKTDSKTMEALQETFEHLIAVVPQSIDVPEIYLEHMKVRIGLYLQDENLVTEMKKFTSVKSLVDFLIKRNFVNCLNVKLLLNTMKLLIQSERFNRCFQEYWVEYEAYMRNTIKDIAAAGFYRTLGPACDLPVISVKLADPWKKELFSNWQKILEDKASAWFDYIVITDIKVDPAGVILTYSVFPSILPKVIKDLTNDIDLIKKFSAIGAEFVISEETVARGNADSERMMVEIQTALSHMKISPKKVTQECTNDSVITPHGGYDSGIFLYQPSDQFQCLNVCYSTLREPLQLECCGATLCKSCYENLRKVCPVCRVRNPCFFLDKSLRSRILKLEVRCIVTGCFWTGALKELKDHETKGCPLPQEKQEEEDDKQKAKAHIEKTAAKRKFVASRSSQESQESQPDSRQSSRDEELRRQISGSKYVYTVVSGVRENVIDWLDKDIISIIVPAGFIPPDCTCDITIRPVSPKNCVFPENTVLVSEIFEVTLSCDHEILKPITLKLRHCVKLTEENNTKCLTFAKASHEESLSMKKFEKFDGGTFTVGSNHGMLWSKSFCWLSILWNYLMGISPKVECSVQVLYHFVPVDCKAHIIVTKNIGDLMETAVKSIKKQKKGTCLLQILESEMLFMLEDEMLVAMEKSSDSIWDVQPVTGPPCKIHREQVEQYNGVKGLPPKLSYRLEPNPGLPTIDDQCIYTFNFEGTTDDPFLLRTKFPDPKSDSSNTSTNSLNRSRNDYFQSDSKHENVLRCHYTELSETIGASPIVLSSVSTLFYQHSFIDLTMKVCINESGSLKGANMLLDQVQLKLQQSDDYLPQVLDIFKQVTALTEIVAKMEDYM